jgi:hypothetical protein
MPPMTPMIHLSGKGRGQEGSTWNFGGSAMAGCADIVCCHAAAMRPITAIPRPMLGIRTSPSGSRQSQIHANIVLVANALFVA